MNKESFLRKLRELLAGIPAAEVEEALEYYRDYFEDAGVENEARVIEELGSPERVAENIRLDLGYPAGERKESTEWTGTYQENTYSDPYPNPYPEQPKGGSTYSEPQKEKGHSVGWIILAICTCWLWAPLLIALISVLFGLSVAAFGIIFGLGAAALGIVIAGIALIGIGIAKMVISPAGGLLLFGIGMLLVGLSLFGIVLVAMICGKAIPALFQGIAWLWRKIFGRGGRAA